MWFVWIWGMLKGPLKKLLGKKFSVVSKNFKVLNKSIIGDVIVATQKGFPLEVIKDVASGDISKGQETLLFLQAIPLDAISSSSKIRKLLVERFKLNDELGKAQDKAGFSKQEWDRILDAYAGDVLRLLFPTAIREMSDNESPLYAGEYVIDLADAETIRIGGKPQSKQLIVLYGKIDDGKHPTISQAKKIWKNRNSHSVAYKLGPYEGAQAK